MAACEGHGCSAQKFASPLEDGRSIHVDGCVLIDLGPVPFTRLGRHITAMQRRQWRAGKGGPTPEALAQQPDQWAQVLLMGKNLFPMTGKERQNDSVP
jgi:hypothetical protein